MTPGVRPGTDPRVLVLDNEAAQALADPDSPKHRTALQYVDALAVRKSRRVSSRIVLPTVVRVEAGIDRRAAGSAAFNRLQIRDVLVTGALADQAAALRVVVGGSAVDACVAATAADESRAGAVVTVLTADLTDIPRLVAAADVHVAVRRI